MQTQPPTEPDDALCLHSATFKKTMSQDLVMCFLKVRQRLSVAVQRKAYETIKILQPKRVWFIKLYLFIS
jgi:hypothetical protein